MGALDHLTGKILAYVFGRREDQALLQLKALLVALGIRRFYTDGWGVYHPPALGTPAACRRQAKDPTAGTQTSHTAHPDQTVGAKDPLLFQIRPDARSCDWAVHQPL
jgi:hypothetical protein